MPALCLPDGSAQKGQNAIFDHKRLRIRKILRRGVFSGSITPVGEILALKREIGHKFAFLYQIVVYQYYTL